MPPPALRYLASIVGMVAGVAFSAEARASNALEYPDNGSAAFSRGGAWLALGNEPIAAHYSPAALVLQGTALSVEQNLTFPHTCFERQGEDGGSTGPNQAVAPALQYREVCSARGAFPNAIPSIAFAWRATPELGFGIAVVPPATYGTAEGQWPALAEGFDTTTGEARLLPAPYRYQQVEQLTTILFPTVSVGYALARWLRVGAGFVSGIGVIDTTTASVSTLGPSDAAGDHWGDDTLAVLRTRDLFVPGVVVSAHVTVIPEIELAIWGRYIDSIRSSTGSLSVTLRPFGESGLQNPLCTGEGEPADYGGCTANQGVRSEFGDALTHFSYPIPPEIRLGVRFRMPRGGERPVVEGAGERRDPLHDDVFDLELDQSYTFGSLAHTIEVRFKQKDGRGTLVTEPTKVPVVPNADRPTGFRDSYGLRLGGQWNVSKDRFGLRAGAWMETRSQEPDLLTVAPVGASRYGFGGGFVVRSSFMDVSVGYQRHLSSGLDNGGKGRLRAPAGTGNDFDLDKEPPGVSAEDRTQFRTEHSVNGGRVSFDAHVFTLGGVARF